MRAPTFTLRSPQTGTDYRLWVEAPESAAESVPAMLFLDGDDQFDAAISAYRAGRAANEIPPLCLVGIGYGASYTKPGNQRIRDYTPTAMATEAGSGGGDAFLTFLCRTLWPELGRRYRLRDDVRGIGGHSLGALLVVSAAFQHRPFFNRFLASAPSLWWDDRSVICSAQTVQRTGAELPARLYFGVGEDDTASMLGDLELLEQQLSVFPFPKLDVISERFPGHDHYNALPHTFGGGLRTLFR